MIHLLFDYMAVANFTRLRPSVIPARRNNVRRCCFTVRGLMLRCPPISLLLHRCARSRKTSSSSGSNFDGVQIDHDCQRS